jgi:hypothetical protein
VIPFAALLALWFRPRAGTPAVRAFVAATLPITVLVIVEVAIFASTQSGRIEERNMFYVAPFGLIALLAFTERGVVVRSRRVLAAAALVAGVLPVAIPFGRFVNTTALSDTFGLLPWWWIQDRGIGFATLRWVALGVSLVAAGLLVFVSRRFTMVLVLLIAAYFVVTGAIVQNGRVWNRAGVARRRVRGIRRSTTTGSTGRGPQRGRHAALEQRGRDPASGRTSSSTAASGEPSTRATHSPAACPSSRWIAQGRCDRRRAGRPFRVRYAPAAQSSFIKGTPWRGQRNRDAARPGQRPAFMLR